MLVISIVFTLSFAFGAGGFSSDLGGDPDEAAHAVTSLMLHDYLDGGLGQHPMRFAKDYYADFPRVALGHYPPLYYVIAAPLLLLHNSVGTLLVFQALTLSLLAFITHLLASRFLKPLLAAIVSLSVVLLPIGLKLTLYVMSDILLAVFCLWASLLWAWYLRAPSVRRALVWGCVATAAILTKGSGMGLCLVPPVATLLSGKWRLIFKWSWWSAALPVALFAGPWMLYSTGISKEGMTQLTPWQYFLQAVPFHLAAMPAVFGWPFTILSAVGIVRAFMAGKRGGNLLPESASLAGMALGTTLVLLLVPVGLSTRYMLTLAPVVLIAAAYGLEGLPWSKPGSSSGKSVLFTALIAVFLFNTGLPVKEVHGFGQAVEKLGLPNKGESKQNWLIASDPRGEGAVIAAGAFGCPQRSPSLLRIYRGSKELASSDWMGRDYRSQFADESAILKHLDELQITRVLVDLSVPETKRTKHEQLLQAAMQSAPSVWALDFDQPITRQPGATGKLSAYKRLLPVVQDKAPN
ncbi:ArnT family glycosyltransferase [Prosthecobacter sp.]|uniref:ArnT family glycosyltransferase n=1 Tax=Prosthecobacter sp. TaxID=1965333 RepID=UPI0037846C2C